jgi:hypothetical protein
MRDSCRVKNLNGLTVSGQVGDTSDSVALDLDVG